MRILFILDPIKKLNLVWDNSLYLLNEMARRGHENWAADAGDVSEKNHQLYARCRKVTVLRAPRWKKGGKYHASSPRTRKLRDFDLILIRKEPPVDETYLGFLSLLEKIADKVPVVNHPRGIRNTNEKLSILYFPKWIPKTTVTHSPETVLEFWRKLGKPIVVKPLDQKGGRGVFLLRSPKNALRRLRRATQNGLRTLMVQEFIKARRNGEKRMVILNGKVLAAYVKRPRGKEFRANLSLGGTFHPASLSAREKKLVAAMRAYLLKEGLYLVGIDTLNGKLLEINVTSPAGITEAKFLYPRLAPAESWADFLEDFSRRR